MVPEADWNPIDRSAIDGGLNALGPCHVLDLKSPSRRIADFRFCHDGNAPAASKALRQCGFAVIRVDRGGS